MSQTERDTIEVIAFLKHEDSQKDQEVDRLKQQVKDLQVKSRADQEQMLREHSDQLDQLQSSLEAKQKEVRLQITMYTVNFTFNTVL